MTDLFTVHHGCCLDVDPFLGSDTTAVAALQEGFRVLGIEADEPMADPVLR